MKLGAHESISGGLYKAFERAKFVGCEVLQLFVRSNRCWNTKPLTDQEILLFKRKASETGIDLVVGHSSYLINLASPEEALWRKSIDTLTEELKRCELLGIPYLVLHPGSHRGKGEEEGLKRIATALTKVYEIAGNFRVKILLETTAGQGTTLGNCFEHLAWIMENTPYGDNLGVCLDTCHIFAAGYDIRFVQAYEETMDIFNRIVGFQKLFAIHLNDSRGELGSRIDRHEHIGKGKIGLEAFRLILNDPRLHVDLPGFLETPKGNELISDRENLMILRSLRGLSFT